jgi:hypothetical protein
LDEEGEVDTPDKIRPGDAPRVHQFDGNGFAPGNGFALAENISRGCESIPGATLQVNVAEPSASP